MATTKVERWGDDEGWRRWRSRWTAVCLPIAGMMVVWGSTPVLSLSLLPGLLGGIGQIVLLTSVQETVSDAYILRTFVATTLFSGLVAVALLTIGSIAVSAAFLLLVALALTSPPGATVVGGLLILQVMGEDQASVPSSREAGQFSSPLEVPQVAQMSDDELCRAWRRSFVALENAATLEQRISLVQMRQDYLDELETRHGSALRAWLFAGARAAGGPERYLA